jgi:roadblock/LC7 domain-containing protein
MEQVKVINLFTETEKVIAEYKVRSEKLNQQESELNAELIVLQKEMTANMLAKESAAISELIYLKIQGVDIVTKTEIINTLLEELAEERTDLKIEYVPVYQEALKNDRQSFAGMYSANEIVNKYRYQMLKEIADIGKQMQGQYTAIAPEIMDVFEDAAVKEKFPRIEYLFNRDHYKPVYGESINTVVHRNDVFLATGGQITDRIPKPKDLI